MSIARAEQLKLNLTDKYVVVTDGVPELRRFAGLTGRVKTVNMNCRALVEFDGAVDIGWYDIEPSYLTVVDGPRPKAEATHKPAAAKPAAPAAAAAGGKSPLDAIRTGGAATPAAAGAKPSPLDLIRKGAGAAPASPAASGEKKPSPLDQIRKSAAPAASPAPAPAAEAAPASPSAAPVAPASGERKLSPIELIRQQQAQKKT